MPSSSPSGVYDRVSSLWFAAAVVILQPAANASTVMSLDRPLLRRELSNGMYKFSAYYVAKCLTSLPFQLLFCTIFSSIAYFMIGLQYDIEKFLGFFLVMVLFALISETLGIAAGGVCREPNVGLIIVSAGSLLLMMQTGFIVAHTRIYFMWLKRVRRDPLWHFAIIYPCQ